MGACSEGGEGKRKRTFTFLELGGFLMTCSVAVAAPTTMNDTILEHRRLVRMIAHNIHRRLPASVELDDLISAGTIGLITAVERYDEARSVPFKGFARLYIQGAILFFLDF